MSDTTTIPLPEGRTYIAGMNKHFASVCGTVIAYSQDDLHAHAAAVTAAKDAEIAGLRERDAFLLAATHDAQSYASTYADKTLELQAEVLKLTAEAQGLREDVERWRKGAEVWRESAEKFGAKCEQLQPVFDAAYKYADAHRAMGAVCFDTEIGEGDILVEELNLSLAEAQLKLVTDAARAALGDKT